MHSLREQALVVKNISKSYALGWSALKDTQLFKAVDDVSLTVKRGTVFGLIGGSGSGKSTLAKIIVGLEKANAGEIIVNGEDISSLSQIDRAKKIQIVLQNPNASLNPRKTIRSILSMPLKVHKLGSSDEQKALVEEMIDLVGLPERVIDKYPRELSGGQKQRVSIARALIMRPEIIVCDEPTSALDVSVQAQVLNLLEKLRRELSLTYLFISHNLAVVDHLSDMIGVMQRGKLVEKGTSEQILNSPSHDYTKLLLRSVLPTDAA